MLVLRHIGVVAGDGEDSILIPRLLLGTFEEVLQRHIRIAYYGIDLHLRIFVLEYILIGIGHTERVVTG